MVALIFLLVIAAVFASVLALEGGDDHLERRPAGLLTWIVSGNWPAKIGGGLMIVGVGALLRYAAINFELEGKFKLAIGIAATVALGIGSFLTNGNPQRRAVSLALGGAAFGIAYLTAYSAFALFGYLPTLQGLGLLALTAVAAGVFAVSRSALSLAVLSMVGAFMAPGFAVDDPGAQVVYGYYVAVSLLTLTMVFFRGWRPLIHLSFLFTLAGGAFFAWTADYFSKANAEIMLPLLVMLVAVHVAMPLLERRWARGRVVESLDTIYLLALPLVAALTALVIAPTRIALSMELWWFAGVWLTASAWLFAQKREGMATHAIIGLLMLGLGLAARYRDLPWELLALGIAVVALVLAARRSSSRRLHGFLAGLVLVLAAVHILSALAPASSAAPFLNDRFFERLVGAALLMVAAITLTRLKHVLDGMMITIALGWAAFTVGAEIARLDLVSAWLILHWAVVLFGFAAYFFARRIPAVEKYLSPLVILIGLSAVLAQLSTEVTLSWISAVLAGASMLAIAVRPVTADEGASADRLLAAFGAPLVVALWMSHVANLSPSAIWQLPVSAAGAFALVVLLIGSRAGKRSERWFTEAVDIFAVGFTFVLAAATLFDIERAWSAAALELICLGALILVASWDGKRVHIGRWVFPIAVIGTALTLQANLLRWLGPAGELNATSVAKMEWPTVVSLLWACIGAALTIAARRVGSRVQWTAGAAFLVGAAIKLLLLDFGSLGQLANILAVIAAGGVFLLVGWLAPMPPARSDEQKEPGRGAAPAGYAPAAPGGRTQTPDSDWHARQKQPERGRRSSDRFAWTVAIVTISLITISQCGTRLFHGRHFAPASSAESFVGKLAPVDTSAPNTIVAAPPPAVEQAATPTMPEATRGDECDQWRAQLPQDFEPHLVTAIPSPSGAPERLIEVDAPGRDVVLVIASNFPALWTIRRSPDTRLVGIWLPNEVVQKFRDPPRDVAMLDARDVAHSCAATENKSSSIPYALAQRVLQRPFASQSRAEEGRWAVIGNPTRQDAAH